MQKTIVLSTIDVEYIVISHICKEKIWLKGVLGVFGKVQGKVNVLCGS